MVEFAGVTALPTIGVAAFGVATEAVGAVPMVLANVERIDPMLDETRDAVSLDAEKIVAL